MRSYQRARRRIEKDKARKAAKFKYRHLEHDNIDQVVTMEHLNNAFHKCRKGVRWKGSVQSYSFRAIEYMYRAYTSIKGGSVPKLVSTKKISLYERGKRRDIVPITIKDRMVQRVLCDYALVPVLHDKLIYDNGASMPGKGIDFARHRISRKLRQAINEYGSDFYVLTFDFKSFFDSIPHRLCQDVLNKYFTDDRLIKAAMDIIKSYEEAEIKTLKNTSKQKFLMNKLNNNESAGICLGSQISQIMALVAPNALDHYIKDQMGMRYYIRYMDDGVIFAKDKQTLWELLSRITEISEKIGLHFNHKKTKVIKGSRGFVFLKIKYRILPSGKVVRCLSHRGIVRMRRKLKKFRQLVDRGCMTADMVYASFRSWLGYCKSAMSYRTRRSMMKLYNKLFDGYKTVKKKKKGVGFIEILQADQWADFRWGCNGWKLSSLPTEA